MPRGRGRGNAGCGRSRLSSGNLDPSIGIMPTVPRPSPEQQPRTSVVGSSLRVDNIGTVEQVDVSAELVVPFVPLVASTTPNSTIGNENDEAHQSGKRIVTTLDSYGLQPSRKISEGIRDIFEHELDIKGINWKSVSRELKYFYWGEFKKKFVWDPAIEDNIRAAWEIKVKERYRDFVCRIKREGKQKTFIQDNVWKSWNDLWKDDKCIKTSTTNLKNGQASGVGKAIGTHTGGSISATEHRKKLEKELGRQPTPSEIHLHMHTHKHDGQNFVGERSKQVNDKFLELREKHSQTSSSVDDSHLFYEAVGGEKKRRIFGLGSDKSHYYGPTLHPSSSSEAQSTALFNGQQALTPEFQVMLHDAIKGMIPDLKVSLKEELLQGLQQMPHTNQPRATLNESSNQSQTTDCAPIDQAQASENS